MIEAFLYDNYVEIMMALVEVTREHGIGLEDVVLELDFMSYGANPGPASVGKFKLDTFERYTAGDRPAKPVTWTNLPMDRILSDLQKRHRISPSSIHAIVRNADSSGSIYPVPNGGMWSNEALACFPLTEGENLERFKSIVNSENHNIVVFQLLRNTLFKADAMAGLDRQDTLDFLTQLQIAKGGQ